MTRTQADLGALVRWQWGATDADVLWGVIERFDAETITVRWEDGAVGTLAWADPTAGRVHQMLRCD